MIETAEVPFLRTNEVMPWINYIISESDKTLVQTLNKFYRGHWDWEMEQKNYLKDYYLLRLLTEDCKEL